MSALYMFSGLCVYMIGQKLIDRRLAEIEAQVRSDQPAEGLYLTYLLSSDKLTRSEVYITVTELLLGGVDTVRGLRSLSSVVCARGPTLSHFSGLLLANKKRTSCTQRQTLTAWLQVVFRISCLQADAWQYVLYILISSSHAIVQYSLDHPPVGFLCLFSCFNTVQFKIPLMYSFTLQCRPLE